MKPSLQHQLDMVWRTENPDYIIIVKNKAGKNMNFQNFELVEAETQPIEKGAIITRYVIGVDPCLNSDAQFNTTVGTIRVTEEGQIVCKMEIKARNYKKWLSKLKQQYKPNTVIHEHQRS